jgi:prepilin signal peptidase PulO-like enzyme (type II secretory pathway)
LEIVIKIFAATFGIIVGSFLNALIYRLPRDINIAFPRSSCPHCQQVIRWYQNIPILSFIFLKGRCAHCGGKISWQYPLIELLVGFFAFISAPADLSTYTLFNFLFYFSIFCAFVVHFVVDIKHQILPDSINLYLAALFLMISLFTRPFAFWLLGGAIGFGFPMAVSWFFYKVKGQIGLGGGDIKLYAALGFFLGPIGVLQNIFLSCFLGAFFGLALMGLKIIRRDHPIPFGPFILVIAFIQIFLEKWFSQVMRHIA